MPRGITIIESVIAASILALASIVIISIYISQGRIYKTENAVAEIKTQKALFIENFRQAGASAATVAETATIGGSSYASSSSTVIFKIPAINSNDNILPGKYDYSVIYRISSDVYIETAPDAASVRKNIKRKLTDAAKNLFFRYDRETPAASALITAYLSLKRGAAEDRIEEAVRLRNK